MERLLSCSLDVYYTPIFMKKNRPAYKLSVICSKDEEENVLDIIFRHTTTLGVRKYDISREVLDRKIVNFRSSFGDIRIKTASYRECRYAYPEYEDLRKTALSLNRDIMSIYREVVKEYEDASECNL